VLVSDLVNIENDTSSEYLSSPDFGLFSNLQILFDYRFYGTHSPVPIIKISCATQQCTGVLETKSGAS